MTSQLAPKLSSWLQRLLSLCCFCKSLKSETLFTASSEYQVLAYMSSSSGAWEFSCLTFHRIFIPTFHLLIPRAIDRLMCCFSTHGLIAFNKVHSQASSGKCWIHVQNSTDVVNAAYLALNATTFFLQIYTLLFHSHYVLVKKKKKMGLGSRTQHLNSYFLTYLHVMQAPPKADSSLS